MSENLSIDEIIKRAEKIKAEADRQLEAASKTLDEKAKNAIYLIWRYITNDQS